MVTSGLSIKLFDFQEKAVIKLIDLTSKKDSKQTPQSVKLILGESP